MGEAEVSTFTTERTGTGTKEWSDRSYNVGLGCSHDCRYCYAKNMALRFGKIEKPEEWGIERIVLAKSMPRPGSVVMFPTTHDITPFYYDEALKAILRLISRSCMVLIVTKAHLDVVAKLCGELSNYKTQIMWRVTIGSLDEHVCRWWEPGAPSPQERLAALAVAYGSGFHTSVSVEPMLEGVAETLRLVEAVKPLVTDKIWIGKMNRVRQRVVIDNGEVRAQVTNIERSQRDAPIHRLHDLLHGDPMIEWKNSIKEVVYGKSTGTSKARKPTGI